MHKGVMLLVKADSKDEAIEKVNKFMVPYGDSNVWDWFVFGGRWSGHLNSKHDEFSTKAHDYLISLHPEQPYVTNSDMERADVQTRLQAIWEEMGEINCNPYCRDSFLYYSKKNILPFAEDSWEDDVLSLKNCIERVKKYRGDINIRKEEALANQLTAIEKEKANPEEYKMSGYYAGQYKDAVNGYFCFDCNIFNIEEEQAESIPDDVEGYFAVMIDMHN
jgi:hypothetical protein